MNTGGMDRRTVSFLLIAGLMFSGSQAGAQGELLPPASGPTGNGPQLEQELRIESLVGILDSDDYAQRELATASLAKIPALDRTKLAEILSDHSLTLEQRQRLESIALDLFQKEPRAGLGVQFAQNPTEFGAAIGRTIEGFDAANVLKPGDVVVAVDGRRVGSSNDLRYSIISRTPGDKLPMTISRDGGELEVAPVLGSYAQLGNAQPLSLRDLLIAWRMWFGRVNAESKAYLEDTIDVIANASSTWVGRPPTPGRVTVGGSVRESTAYAGVSGFRDLNNNPNIRIQVFQNGVPVDPANMQVRDPRRIQLEAIDTQLTILRLQVEVSEQSLDKVSPARRVEIETQIGKFKAQIEGLERRRAAIADLEVRP